LAKSNAEVRNLCVLGVGSFGCSLDSVYVNVMFW